MTPARKKALQWIHDRGEVRSIREAPITAQMLLMMERDGQVQWRSVSPWRSHLLSLTDKGRRILNGDDK